TAERERRYAISAPYQFVSELLVVPAKDTKTRGLPDLNGKTVSVRKSSSYYETLSNIQERLGLKIAVIPENREPEDHLAEVSQGNEEKMEREESVAEVRQGKMAATVSDSNIVQLEQTHNTNIRSVGPIGDVVEVGWVMRQDQPALTAEVDQFMKKLYKGTFYNIMVGKYFKDSKRLREEQARRPGRGGALSPYDTIVKKHARTYELDWRLVTAQMYQESQFNPNATSWVGAKGLMQVMPRTGLEMKITNLEDPDQGILA